jgi:hypothetical protein
MSGALRKQRNAPNGGAWPRTRYDATRDRPRRPRDARRAAGPPRRKVGSSCQAVTTVFGIDPRGVPPLVQRAEPRYLGATSVIIGHSTKFCVGSAGEDASWQMISF